MSDDMKSRIEQLAARCRVMRQEKWPTLTAETEVLEVLLENMGNNHDLGTVQEANARHALCIEKLKESEAEIERLKGCLKKANSGFEEYERKYYLEVNKVEDLEEVLRSLACYVGAGGYNADKVDPKVFEAKIRWGIDELAKQNGDLIRRLGALADKTCEEQSNGPA